MFKISYSRRVLLAAASVALVGGGVALPAAAMAAPAPQHGVTAAPQGDDEDGPGLVGDLLGSDLSIPGVMGGDLMDPGYPQGMGGTHHRWGGLSSWRGD